jgi:two-component system, OmpR family, alkaline phosphatase synthesis response regulator PhoP
VLRTLFRTKLCRAEVAAVSLRTKCHPRHAPCTVHPDLIVADSSRIRATLLVVEDDAALAAIMVRFLRAFHFRVWAAGSGAEAEALLAYIQPDVIVLDLILPDVDGLILCSIFKSRTSASVIISSGRHDPLDVALSKSVGADDFLAKPFSLDSLVEHIDAVLRRRESAELNPPGQLHVGELIIDPRRGRATVGERPLSLTPTQFRLLVALATRHGEPVSRQTLMSLLWEDEPRAGPNHLLDVHISRLRARLASGPQPAPKLATIKGRGYALVAQSAREAVQPRLE